MSPLACPVCAKAALRLLEATQAAVVDYYRCLECGHVWTTRKDSAELVSHVTPVTNKPKP